MTTAHRHTPSPHPIATTHRHDPSPQRWRLRPGHGRSSVTGHGAWTGHGQGRDRRVTGPPPAMGSRADTVLCWVCCRPPQPRSSLLLFVYTPGGSRRR
eukprot:scaffold4286_cov60-Phaeocystis_antarctica.AAC.2